MPPTPTPRPLKSSALAALRLVALLVSVGAASGVAQDNSPDRGARPGVAYALSDIETINAANGNLMMNVPLASLPAGRAGSGGGVGLVYNSKLYDSYGDYYEDLGRSPYPYVVQRTRLRPSDQGGWRYPLYYRLDLLDRMDQYGGPQSPYAPQYPDDQARAKYKVRIAFPDGSTHELIPQVPQGHQLLADGYWDVRPDGYRATWAGSSCFPNQCVYVQNQPLYTGTMVYYSVDGTFLRLEVQHDSDDSWGNNPWTLYFPGGGKVTSGPAQPQRTYDRNGNYTEVREATVNGRPVVQVADELGRAVTIDYGVPVGQYDLEDHISTQGFGEQLLWRVHWKTIYVGRSYDTHLTDDYPLKVGIHSVVDRVTLPAQAGSPTYTFGYNARDWDGNYSPPSYGWGELSSVTLPSGARASYAYAWDGLAAPIMADGVLQNSPTGKNLVYRPEYDLTAAPSATPCDPQDESCVTETWAYTYGQVTGGGCATAPDGGTACEENDDWGRSWRSQKADGTVVERIWQQNAPHGYTQPWIPDFKGANNYVKTEFTSIPDAAGNLTKTAIRDYDYDKNGNVTGVREYDWVPYSGAGSVPRDANGHPTGLPTSPAPTLKRVTASQYHYPTPAASNSTTSDANTYSLASSPRLLGAVASTEVGSGTQTLARSEFTYDNPSTTGNLTQQRSWDSGKGTYSNPLTASNWVSTSQQYDGYGNPTLSTDARGVQTQLVYDPVGGYTNLYPTETRAADNYASLRRTTQTQYDFATGLVTRVTDADNNVENATTYDALGRPTLACAADNVAAAKTCTATEYSDALRRVIVRTDLDSAEDGKLVSVQHYDQLGRIRLTRRLESAAQSATDETHGVKVQTRYQITNPCHPNNTPACVGANGQSMASYQLVSNPYRAAYSHLATNEPSMGWSRSKSDRGGRMVEAQTFNGWSLPAPWGTNTASSGAVTTVHDAEFTTVTDQAGRVRRSVTDAFGRLARVDEPTTSGLGAANAPHQPTSYLYDALGNLTKVCQGALQTNGQCQNGQERSFQYSSLSRLTSAANPESGTLSYTYDEGGNLLTKTDARPVTITYAYDALSRNTTVEYSNTTASPDIKRYYDNQTAGAYGKGRFHYDCKGADCGALTDLDERAFDSYDALGRPVVMRQRFKPGGVWSAPYQTSRQYNRAGGVVSQTYPSGRAVAYSHDAAGRLSGFTGDLGDGAARVYASDIAYDEGGRMREERFGTQTPLYNKRHYNARGQLYDVRLSTVGWATNDWDWNRGILTAYYGGAPHGQTGANNNGNVTRAEHWIPTDPNSPYGTGGQGPWAIYATDYLYDELNRISSATETALASEAAAATNFIHAYRYDRFGNREIDLQTDPQTNLPRTWVNAARMAPGVTINTKQFSVNTANNRLGVPSGQGGSMVYDNAGNLTADTYSAYAQQREYDAENRMTLEQNSQSSIFYKYGYDADGRRTRREAGGQVTHQVYGLDGELLAEYAAGAPASSPRKEYGYRAGELLVTAEPSRSNVALAANGGVATASSSLGANYPASAVVNGDRKGLNWNAGGGWNDATLDAYPQVGFPDWLQVDFSGSKAVDEIDVFTLQDTPATPAEPTESMTFSLYGATGYDVQYWTGSAWATVTGGSVSGNNKVWRKFTFAPVTTTKIRVMVTGAGSIGGAYSRLTEVEAWGTAAGGGQTSSPLLARWKFDEGTGASATDSSGNGHTGTLAGPTRVAGLASAGALDFDGVNDRVTSAGQATAANDFTLSFWVKPDVSHQIDAESTTGTAGVSGQKYVWWPNWVGGADAGAGVSVGTNGVSVYEHSNGYLPATLVYQGAISGWTHVSVVYQNKQPKLYVNGALVKTGLQSPRANVYATLQNIGGDAYGYLDGGLDDVRLYGGALTVAEVEGLSGAGPGGASLRWLVSDHLGTPRMTVDGTGSLASITRHDYLPFGEEVGAGIGGRTTGQGYAGDNVRQQFTGYERDDETGLNFAQARYYSSIQGRFTSVDPIYTVLAERAVDPQQINLYAYSRNNPMRYIDPTGMKIDTSKLSEKELKKWGEIVEMANAKDELGDYVNPELHQVYQLLQDNKRTFFIEDHEFGDRSQVTGLFTITKFEGDNDFSEAVLKLDFSRVEGLKDSIPAELVSGFNKYGGSFDSENGQARRRAELFGHEGAHAIYAINNPAEAVSLEKLMIDRDTSVAALPRKNRYPLPPEIKVKSDAIERGLIPTERFAQETAQRINRELNSSRGSKCKTK